MTGSVAISHPEVARRARRHATSVNAGRAPGSGATLTNKSYFSLNSDGRSSSCAGPATIAAIIIEQTSGLRSHHRMLYDEMQEALLRLPYVWRHSLVRAEEVGAPHARARLVWAGVRRAGAWVLEGRADGPSAGGDGRRC